MITINLTTTHNRLELCSATIWSLLHQSMPPDQINLWISHDPYMADEGILQEPRWVYELNSIHDHDIVKVHYVKNTGPYRKIIPALRNATDNDILVYADDDVIYGSEWFKSLIEAFEENNSEYVVASRVRVKSKNIFGKQKSYNMLSLCTQNLILKSDYIITGIGGCVLMKRHIKEELLLLDDFLDIAPKTDDIWLSKIMELSSVAVFCCVPALGCIQEISHSTSALNQINTVKPIGGAIKKRLLRMSNKIFGYLGIPLSNNDIAISKTDYFFEKRAK